MLPGDDRGTDTCSRGRTVGLRPRAATTRSGAQPAWLMTVPTELPRTCARNFEKVRLVHLAEAVRCSGFPRGGYGSTPGSSRRNEIMRSCRFHVAML